MRTVQVPGYGPIKFPDNMSDTEIALAIERDILPAVTAPAEGVMAAGIGGGKRLLSSIQTAGESLFGGEEAARRGAERSAEIGREYAPGASLEAVKQAYRDKGLLSAAGEAITQIPSAISEQIPNLAAMAAGARGGAMAGAKFGPKGALVGGVGGALAAPLTQLYGSFLERQAEEGADISRSRALAAAVPGAALETVGVAIPLGGRLIGKIFGPTVEKTLFAGKREAAEELAKEGLGNVLAKGTLIGAGAEIPVEVGQQILERWQAGLPLTTNDALAEYAEAAYGAGLVGGPFGAVGRVGQRAVARGEVKAEEERAAELQKELESQLKAAPLEPVVEPEAPPAAVEPPITPPTVEAAPPVEPAPPITPVTPPVTPEAALEEEPPPFETTPLEQPPLPRPAIIEQTEADIQREAQRIKEIEDRKPTKSTSLYEFLAYRSARDKTKDFVNDNRIDFKELIDIESERTKTGKIVPSSKLRFIGKDGGRSISSMIKGQELNPWLREDLWITGTEDAEQMAEKESEAEEYIKDRLRNRDYITEETKNELNNIGMSLENLERTLYELTQEYESDEQRRQAVKDIITEIDAELEFTPPETIEAPPAGAERGIGKPAGAAGPEIQSLSQAQTGQPFSYQGFRGKGKTAEEIYTGAKVPVAGPGRYIAINREDASMFGDEITQEPVTLNNPLVIRTDSEWRDLTRRAGWEFPNPFGLDEDTVRRYTDNLAKIATGDGYDGLVIDPSEVGDTAKTLRNVFGIPQIVDYRGAAQAEPQAEPKAEPSPVQISPEEQKQQALVQFRQAITNTVPGFRALHPSGRVSTVRPKPLNNKQISLIAQLAKDAIELGMPASLLSKVTAAGSTGMTGSAAVAPSNGWLTINKQWSSLSNAERVSTLIHELGHTVDWDGKNFGAISKTSQWANANEELRQWYERDSTTKNPVSYPFSKAFIRKIPDKRPESFAQAFALYFTAPVQLQTNAPTAYSAIQSIVEGIQNESARTAGAATPTTTGVEVRKARVGKGAEVQPEARAISAGVGRAGRVGDRGAITEQSPEDKRRADMERDLFRLTPAGQIAEAAGVQGDLFGATGDLAAPQKPLRRKTTPEGQLPLLGEAEIAPSMQAEPNEYPTRRNIFGQPIEAAWGRQNESKLDTFIHFLQDKMIDVKRVQEQIRKSGKEITDRWNAYLKEELFHGRSAKKTKDFLFDELDPLMRDMEKRGVGMAEFEEYLHMRTAKERNALVAQRDPENYPDGGSGITNAQVDEYFAELAPKKRADYEALAKRIDAITKGTRELLVKSGHESRETIEAWEKALPNYVPLNRAEADYELSNMGTGVGQGFAVRGQFARGVVGSERAVVDILANIAMQRERAIVRTEKMRVGQALYGLVLQNPNPNFWLAVDPEAQAKPQDIDAITRTLIGMGFSPFSPEVTNLQNLMQSLMQQPTIRKVNTATNQVVNAANLAMVNSPYALPIRINGVDKYIFFNPQDPIANRMAKSLRNVDADQMDKVLGPIAKVTRYFAAINTQYNPIFGVINFMRDVQGALIQLSSTPLAGKQKEVMAKVMPALRGIYADLRARRENERATGEYENLWNRFQDLGGQTGFRDQFSRSEERADALYEVMNPSAWTETTLGKIFTANGKLKVPLEAARKSVAKPIFDWLSDYNETMENAIRLAAFKTALDSGMTDEQAASVAKNLTVNFNRKGLIGKQAGALYAFFNASVQGTARMAQTLFTKEDGKISLSKTGKTIFYGGLLLGSAQAMLLAAAGFDEEEPPQFIRERNIVIPVGGGKYVTIPMPLGYNVIPNTSRILTEWAMSGFQDTPKRVAGITSAMLDMFNPIGNAGWSWQTFSPTIADIPVALFENRDWTGKPIAKEDFSSLDPSPGYTRARETASWFSKNLSEFLNLASGGTAFKPGLFSPTPDQIDYLIGQLTGGVGRELLKAEQTVTSSFTGEELPTYKIPLVGRFVGDVTGQAAVRNQFYVNLKELNLHQREIEGRRKEGQNVQEYLRDNPEARLYRMADKIERNVQQLRKRRETLIEKGASKEQVQAVEKQITLQMQRLNEAIDRVKQ